MVQAIRRSAGAFAVIAALSIAGAPAAAQITVQDGLVNVNVGDVTILQNVDIAVAAQVAAEVCGVRVGPVAVLARTVDRTSRTRTICGTDQGPVTISQN